MMAETIKKNGCVSFSKGFRKKYARLMQELGYEEVIRSLSAELKQLSTELQALTSLSEDVDSKRAELDQTLLKICADWQPRYKGDSILNSKAIRAYNERIDLLYEQEHERTERLTQLSRRISLISDALVVCNEIGRGLAKEHTA